MIEFLKAIGDSPEAMYFLGLICGIGFTYTVGVFTGALK